MRSLFFCSFFFNDTATTEIYTLSLHDALPICSHSSECGASSLRQKAVMDSRSASCSSEKQKWRLLAPKSRLSSVAAVAMWLRSEEHTSELQSRQYLVCRLLLEKKILRAATTYI